MNNEFALLTNMYDTTWQKNLKQFLGKPLIDSYYKSLFFHFNKITIGSLVFLDIIPEDCISKTGIIKARKQFLNALKYAVENLDVKIVLLAASTKRLFGKEIELKVNWDGNLDNSGFTLNELYPNILFTNGDNGTDNVLEMEIDSILDKEKIIPENENQCNFQKEAYKCSGAVIINGLGLLGTNSLLHLIEKQFCDKQVIVISNYTKELESIIGKSYVHVYSHISEIQNHCCLGNKNAVKMIINCTHHPSQKITFECIAHIQNGQKIHVIDVAVPYGFPEEEFCKCKNVYRQDGGNAYIENGLEFFFNPEICGLTENVLYGCFAETDAISAYLKENPEKLEYIRSFDFFNVNKRTKEFVKGLFDKYGIGIAPEPFNFNKMIKKS